MDMFKWKFSKKTIEVKENSKRKMKDSNKILSRKKNKIDRVKDN